MDAIANAIATFRTERWALTEDGELLPRVLEGLPGAELSSALSSYVKRAQRSGEDAALLAGTGKDLLEATAGAYGATLRQTESAWALGAFVGVRLPNTTLLVDVRPRGSTGIVHD